MESVFVYENKKYDVFEEELKSRRQFFRKFLRFAAVRVLYIQNMNYQ